MILPVFFGASVRTVQEPGQIRSDDYASSFIVLSEENRRAQNTNFAIPGHPQYACGRCNPFIGESRFPRDRCYVEFEIVAIGSGAMLGFATSNDNMGFFPGYHTSSYGYRSNGQKWNANSGSSFGSTWTTGNTVGMAVDQAERKLWFSVNGVWQASGDPAAGTNPAFVMNDPNPHIYRPAFGILNGTNIRINFGQKAFNHAPPAGFVAGWGR